jgi:hypothetical protein
MDAAGQRYELGRGAALLLAHCTALARFDELRPSPYDRLESVLGLDLARLLLRALAGDHRMRPRGLVG